MVAHYRNYWFIYGYSLSSPLAVSFLRISIRVLGKMLAEEIT